MPGLQQLQSLAQEWAGAGLQTKLLCKVLCQLLLCHGPCIRCVCCLLMHPRAWQCICCTGIRVQICALTLLLLLPGLLHRT